jgi:hypothetical protein
VAVPDDDATASQPQRRPSKADERMRLFERAWWSSGAEIRDGAPYLSRSALRDLLVADGASERTARNKTESSRPEGLIAPMINGGLIEPAGHGWIVVHTEHASAMVVRKGTK